MPRNSRSSGGFGGRSSYGGSSRSASPNNYGSRSASPNNYQQARPQPVNTQSNTPMQSGGGMLGGIGQTIVTGMAFGGGSEIGHQVVRGLMGGNSHNNQPVQNHNQNQPMESNQNQNQNMTQEPKKNFCNDYNVNFINCLKMYDNNISSCQSLFDDLKSCEKSLI